MASRYVLTLAPSSISYPCPASCLDRKLPLPERSPINRGQRFPARRVRATPAGGGSGTTTVAGPQGNYQIPSLPAANYVVRIEAQGFTQPSERSNCWWGKSR